MEGTKKRPGLWQMLLIGMGFAISGFLPALQLVLPGFLAYLGVSGGWFALGVAALAGAAAVLTLAGTSGLWLLLPVCLPGIGIAAAVRRKAAWFETALLASCLAAGALYAVTCGPDLLAGRNAFFTVQETIAQIWEVLEQQLKTLPNELLAGIDGKMIARIGANLRAQAPIIMPAIICFFGACIGLFSVLICRRLALSAGAQLKPMRPFMFWRVPGSFIKGLLTMAAGIIILALLQLPALDAVLPAVIVVACVPFCVQGISLTMFFFMLRKRRRGTGLLIAGLVVLSLLGAMMYFITLFTSMGLLEQVLHIRRRMLEQMQNNQDRQE